MSAPSEIDGARLVLRLRQLPAAVPLPARRQHLDIAGRATAASAPTPLACWSGAAAGAYGACMVVDAHGRVVSLSASAATLLGCRVAGVTGRPLLSVVDLVDFDTGASGPDYAGRVAPLAVLGGQGLIRSLLRFRRPDGGVVTLDTSSAPLHDVGGAVVGSLTFFAVVA